MKALLQSLILSIAVLLLFGNCAKKTLSASDKASASAAGAAMGFLFSPAQGGRSASRLGTYINAPTVFCDGSLSAASPEFTITTTCPTTELVEIALELKAPLVEHCGSTDLTISTLKGTATMDWHDVTHAASYGGTLHESVDATATIGGKTLTCKMSGTEDMSLPASTRPQEIDCSSLSCTYDGVALSCDDIKAYAKTCSNSRRR